MPFGSITANTLTYEPRQPGVYSLSTVSLGDPENAFQIRGGVKGKDNLLRGSVQRILEKDVTIGSDTYRKGASVKLNLTVPHDGFTSAEIDGLAADISEFLTASTITRLLQGES